MSEISNFLWDAWTFLQHAAEHPRIVHVNPWAAAIIAGLIAAFMEQRRAARRAAPFTDEHIGAAGHASRPR